MIMEDLKRASEPINDRMYLNHQQMIRHIEFLCLVLRHQPESIGIKLDSNGWVIVDDLLNQSEKHGFKISKEILLYVINNNEKKRFAITHDFQRIRACQGHTISVDLGYISQPPPNILFHGTSRNSLEHIYKHGIKKGKRQFVHLSEDMRIAQNAGNKHGVPVVLVVKAAEMHRRNYHFFLSENGVWLTEHVPNRFLSVLP